VWGPKSFSGGQWQNPGGVWGKSPRNIHIHNHPLLYVYPTGDSVPTQRKPGTLANRGQSPIGECVFKQMSPLVGVYKRRSIHTYTMCI